MSAKKKGKTATKPAKTADAGAAKGPSAGLTGVFPFDEDADTVARRQRAEADEAKKADIAKRKPYVEGCQSCENWAAGYSDTLTCGHDQKK